MPAPVQVGDAGALAGVVQREVWWYGRPSSDLSRRASLHGRIVESEKRLASVLEEGVREGPWWWLRSSNADLRKYLERFHDALRELDRLLVTEKLGRTEQDRLGELLEEAEFCLPGIKCDGARRLEYSAQMLLLEVGDAEVICGRLEVEKHWKKTMTSILTWDALYPDEDHDARALYCEGHGVPRSELESARNKLLSLFIARRDEELAYAARTGVRTSSLNRLSVFLVLLLSAFLFAYAFASNASVWGIIMLPLAGALGAALSGTLKTRDLPNRQTDLERVRSALVAQLLVGAVFGVIIVFILQSGLVSIGKVTFDASTVLANAAVAFIAGFSEPFALRTVDRVAKLGGGAAPSETSTTQHGAA